ASELAFLLEPSDVIAVRDRPLLLSCQVEGEGPITVTWRKNGIPVATGQRASVLANGSLLIQNFHKRRESNETDAGEYDCAAQSRYGIVVSRKARVQLASLPKFHTHPESMTVDEGGVARFQCQVNGIPEANITWEKNRTALSTKDNRYTLLPAGILQITGVRRADTGVYRCVATNIANTRYSQEAQLNVTVAAPKTYKEPVILSGPQNLTITVHQTAILECIATGNPRPIVSWSRLDGRSIGVEGIQVLGTGNLMISDVSLQHSGVYVCAANRPGTRVRRTALGRLVVQGKPEYFPQMWTPRCSNTGILKPVQRSLKEPHVSICNSPDRPPNSSLLNPGGQRAVREQEQTCNVTHNLLTRQGKLSLQCLEKWAQPTLSTKGKLAVISQGNLRRSRAGLTAWLCTASNSRCHEDESEANGDSKLGGYLLKERHTGEDCRELIGKRRRRRSLDPADVTSISFCFSLSVPATPSFFTKMVNATAVQAFWELPSKPGKVEGFKLYHRRVPQPDFQGPHVLPGNTNSFILSQLVSFSQTKISRGSFSRDNQSPEKQRSVEILACLKEQGVGGETACNCRQESEGSMAGIVVGIHIAMACIIFCVLFLMFGYRRSLFCRKGTQDSWSVPR
uniref:Si:ch211-57n23.4 n=1 Tax=Lepisosteus oculatus TaxID=7918 RepID=W5MQM0_LEPOC